MRHVDPADDVIELSSEDESFRSSDEDESDSDASTASFVAHYKPVYENERGIRCYDLQEATTSRENAAVSFTAAYNEAPSVWNECEDVGGSVVEEEVG